MKVIQSDIAYKGTRILLGNEKRALLQECVNKLVESGYTEISIPVIQLQDTFAGKVGEENNNLMFNFTDRKDRQICLAPEYTAVVQKLSGEYFKFRPDTRLFYIQECFRGERQQAGRYRQFTQLGVEILNPRADFLEELIELASELIVTLGITDFEVLRNVTRGLDYYKGGKGFEITCARLGSSKQICGGGEYAGGIGFAVGVDRIISAV